MAKAMRPGRKQTGTLLERKGGFFARIWRDIDGKRTRTCVPLNTFDRDTAIERMADAVRSAESDYAPAQRVDRARWRINAADAAGAEYMDAGGLSISDIMTLVKLANDDGWGVFFVRGGLDP